MQHLCSQCGAQIAPGATVCPRCGAALDEAVPTQPLRESVPTQPLAMPGPSAAFPEPAQSPSQQRRLAPFVVLPLLCIVLIVGLGAGGFWFYVTRPHSTTSARPPLYANSLTKREPTWQCQKGALCQNDARGLHVLATTDHLYFSFLSGKHFSEQVIEVRAKLDNGNPEFVGVAIAFRSVGINGYGWVIYANGTYQLVKWDNAGAATNLVPLTRSPFIHTGLEQINALKIIAKGPTLTLFMNGHQLQQITDSTYTSGGIALGAARFAADAVFSNLVITKP